MRVETKVIARAMLILAEDIHSGDGISNLAILEAAERLEELESELSECNKTIARLILNIDEKIPTSIKRIKK